MKKCASALWIAAVVAVLESNALPFVALALFIADGDKLLRVLLICTGVLLWLPPWFAAIVVSFGVSSSREDAVASCRRAHPGMVYGVYPYRALRYLRRLYAEKKRWCS